MGLPRVDDVLSFSSPDADLAYTESRAAADGLVKKFGWEAVKTILGRVAQGEEFGDAFHNVTGVEYEAWQADWLETAQQRYRKMLFMSIDEMIWILIMLLAITATISVWIRRRRQFRIWLAEEEDNEEDIPPIDDTPIKPH